jgi:hypothetical protein
LEWQESTINSYLRVWVASIIVFVWLIFIPFVSTNLVPALVGFKSFFFQDLLTAFTYLLSNLYFMWLFILFVVWTILLNKRIYRLIFVFLFFLGMIITVNKHEDGNYILYFSSLIQDFQELRQNNKEYEAPSIIDWNTIWNEILDIELMSGKNEQVENIIATGSNDVE